MPRVSVIVPNYNHAAYLQERMDSIRGQTFQDYELILLDDASTDDSLEMLRGYRDQLGATLIENRTNSGSPFVQWDRGVSQAKGEYVWIAESDDVAEPEFLDRLVCVLDAHPQVGLVEANLERIDVNGQSLGPVLRETATGGSPPWTKDFVQNGTDYVKQFLYYDNIIPSASGVLFRRRLYEQTGPAAIGLDIAGDWWKWCQILQKSDFAFVSAVLNRTRIHESTRRSATAFDGRREIEALLVQRFISRALPIESRMKQAAAARYATSWVQHLRSGRWQGRWRDHVKLFRLLVSLNKKTALHFLFQMPIAWIAWILKQGKQPADRPDA